MARSTYYDQLDKLIKKGYLVQTSGNGYEFYEVSQIPKEEIKNINKKLLKEAGYEVEEINSFAKLEEAAKDITARKDELGFSAFTSAGLEGSSSWRFSGHLANMPLFYEFEADKITSQPATIKGTYLSAFRNVWDLYINNSTVAASELPSKTGTDTLADFTTGKAVFYQNGTWEYGNVIAEGSVVLTGINTDVAAEGTVDAVKTAIENKQNLIVEGCYIPFDWQKDFDNEYLQSIKYYCLVMSEDFIKNNFDSIKNHANY